MTEDQARKVEAQSREFPHTLEIIQRVRDAMAAQLFQTKVGESAIREGIFLRVQTLDAMMMEMQGIMRLKGDDKAIEEYVKRLAATNGQ